MIFDLDQIPDFSRKIVGQPLKVGGFPSAAIERRGVAGRDDLEAFFRSWGPYVLEKVTLASGDRLAFINKANPHALYDSMLIQTDDDVRSSTCSLGADQAIFAYRTAAEFVNIVSDPEVMDEFELSGGSLHIVSNVNPHTDDRENGMGYSKRFHLHMNYWPKSQLKSLDLRSMSEMAVSPDFERIFDPLLIVSESIIRDVVERHGLFSGARVVESQSDPTLPMGSIIAVPQGWENFRSPNFMGDLRRFEMALHREYWRIHEAFTGCTSPSEMWSRPELRPAAEIVEAISALELSTTSRISLTALAGRLRNLTPRLWRLFRKSARQRIRHLAMNGPNYSLGFYSKALNTPDNPLNNHDVLYLVTQAKLFSDVGGAGMIYLPQCSIVEIKRKSWPFSKTEVERRSAFQKLVLSRTLR
ncbi:MAG: hypothetical protein RIC85_00545 [Gammaproteobacteria bacterium]